MRQIRNVGLIAAAIAAAGVGLGMPASEAKRVARSEPVSRYPKNPKLNRSNKWPTASTYEEARAMSPSSRPVR